MISPKVTIFFGIATIYFLMVLLKIYSLHSLLFPAKIRIIFQTPRASFPKEYPKPTIITHSAPAGLPESCIRSPLCYSMLQIPSHTALIPVFSEAVPLFFSKFVPRIKLFSEQTHQKKEKHYQLILKNIFFLTMKYTIQLLEQWSKTKVIKIGKIFLNRERGKKYE